PGRPVGQRLAGHVQGLAQASVHPAQLLAPGDEPGRLALSHATTKSSTSASSSSFGPAPPCLTRSATGTRRSAQHKGWAVRRAVVSGSRCAPPAPLGRAAAGPGRGPVPSSRTAARCGGGGPGAVPAAELLDAPGGVHDARGAGPERVARVGDVDVDDGVGAAVLPLDRAGGSASA